MECFSNFRNGMEILQQVLTQLLLQYTRFQVRAALMAPCLLVLPLCFAACFVTARLCLLTAGHHQVCIPHIPPALRSPYCQPDNSLLRDQKVQPQQILELLLSTRWRSCDAVVLPSCLP